jgi:glycerophosphoryl diester phosphodiesterase
VSTFIPELPTTVVGHRGALYQYLENTREGFLHCAQLGCHAIELDVFVLKDGHVVVFHGGGTDEHPGDVSEYCLFMDNVVDHEKDDTKQPPPPPKRNIMDMTYEETQQLQFNPDFAEFACDPELIRQARIPLLEHVLQDLMPYPDLEIKIELKGPGVVQPVLELVERYQMQHRCSYSSFQLDMLAELRTLRPDPRLYPTGALFTIPPPDYIERAMHVGATEIHIRYDQCHVDIIKTIHQAGFRSMAWMRGPIGMAHDVEHAYHDIENEEGWECYRCLLETGVQQICCNKPDVLLQLLSSLALLREDNIMDPLSPQLQLESVSSWEEENSSISECL